MSKSLMYERLVRPIVATAMFVGISVSQQASAATLTINTENKAGLSANVGFRYLVEEDTMYKPTPGTQDNQSLSFQFHRSHTPVVVGADGQGIHGETAAGETSAVVEVPDNGNYFVSVLPYKGHALGGVAVQVGTDPVTATVRVNDYPIPTAQISIQVFEDNSPINGAIDPGERGLNGSIVGVDGEKKFIPFHVTLEDPAGQYGAGGGRVASDAYGNPLGTDYSGMDANGKPIVSSYPAGYDTNGMIVNPGALTPGSVKLVPNDQGYLVIKNLRPGKYGVIVTPPAGAGWRQTTSIEGTFVNDAWVKAGNPEVFVEFGPPGPHVAVGFVRDFDCINNSKIDHTSIDPDLNPCVGYIPPAAGTGATITGKAVDNHMSRSPDFQFHPGTDFPSCVVGINEFTSGQTIYNGPCTNSAFTIENVPPGQYNLSIFDDPLDAVIASHPFTVGGNATDGFTVSALTIPTTGSDVNGNTTTVVPTCTNAVCDLGELPLFNWFFKLDTSEFFDRNENGFRDCVTTACDDPAVDDVRMNASSFTNNIRWRDGRIYQSAAVDGEGSAPFNQVFPFFHWLVAESDFAKFKATGATITVDNGGGNNTGGGALGDILNPANDLQTNGYIAQLQETDANGIALQPCNDADPTQTECTHDGGWSLTEKGQVLTLGVQGFLGQKSVLEFGRTNYGVNENGGISGVAVYAITRAEHDPRYAVTEIWEPGIPRVQFALYQDADSDGVSDDIDGVAGFMESDVDNYPLGWATGGAMGPEDIDRDGNTTFDYHDAIDVTWSDSWDDNEPTNCQGYNQMPGIDDHLCFDGMRNWNQVRPAVFDGGYAFPNSPNAANVTVGADGKEYLTKGYYVVQAFTPPGYELVKEESKNVDFGDEYAIPQLLPVECVGDLHTVPALLSYVTAADGVTQVVDGDPADYAAPYAGEQRPLCDKKHILLTDGRNAATDFHFFTDVPKAAHVVGGILNDLANEFNPSAPTFGEKFAPPWLPVAFYDWSGKEITRVYTDEFGKYNAMLPSSSTANAASPSGYTPNMIVSCMNDAGYVDDPFNPGKKIVDPNHNPQYTQFCYTFQYMPGATTYLDTPVLQMSAFAGSGLQLDCEAADTTPLIASVTAGALVGPYIPDQVNGDLASRTLTITSAGLRNVLNPSSNELTSKFVTRNYGFGAVEGNVTLTNEAGQSYNLVGLDWTDSVIAAPVDGNVPNGRYQLTVENAAGVASPMGVSVIVGPLRYAGSNVIEVHPSSAAGATPLQDALDSATRGDLILVEAGVYDEMPIMTVPVYLQGAGAYSTTINARALPAEKVTAWKNKIATLLGTPNGLIGDKFDLLPGQNAGPMMFDTEEGPGLMVLGKSSGGNRFNNGGNSSGFDGFTVTGASTGGGIFVNGYINGFDISNNLVTGNEGTYGGGIRIGHYNLLNGTAYTDSNNDNIRIHHNFVNMNGTQNGAGGGIALYNGTNNYRVLDNMICGNFAATDGAGIGHLGLSSGGRIKDNKIIFNQSFRQMPGFETDGGGILVAGMDSQGALGLSEGSGHVFIDRNLIQGNQAGAGDGAGIALRRTNGLDIAADPANNLPRTPWWLVRITNNTIVNNVAGLAGGGISLKDALRVEIENNTIANNETTGTAGGAFQLGGTPGQSAPHTAGIASYGLETLAGVSTSTINRFNKAYSNPLLQSNIIWHNKQSYFVLSADANIAGSSLVDAGYSDLGVVNVPGTLDQIRWSLVTDATTGNGGVAYPAGWHIQDDTDIVAGDLFVAPYLNSNPGLNPKQVEFQTMMVAPALDEGGNWIDVRYAPLSINDVDGLNNAIDVPSDYHLTATTVAIDAGNPRRGRRGDGLDIDLQPGVVDSAAYIGSAVDQGSDEVQQ
jgi:large repetitive protein